MEITEELKNKIDNSTYAELLLQWRHTPIGAPLFQGESCDYFQKVMLEKRTQLKDNGVSASKSVGWN